MHKFNYHDRKKDKSKICVKCQGTEVVPHHIYGRRNSDTCIWLCWGCHLWVHANPQVSKILGYMKVRNTKEKLTKKKETKKCDHAKYYFDKKTNKIICNFCKKEQ